MSQQKHTPGPWDVAMGRYLLAKDTEGDTVEIAVFRKDDDWEVEQQANIRLVLSAPDLLAAIDNLENDDGSIPEHAWDILRAASAKAGGRWA